MGGTHTKELCGSVREVGCRINYSGPLDYGSQDHLMVFDLSCTWS